MKKKHLMGIDDLDIETTVIGSEELLAIIDDLRIPCRKHDKWPCLECTKRSKVKAGRKIGGIQ